MLFKRRQAMPAKSGAATECAATDLIAAPRRVQCRDMKLTLAIVAYTVIALVLGWGILAVMHGSYWVLIVGGLAYLLAFARLGCSGH